MRTFKHDYMRKAFENKKSDGREWNKYDEQLYEISVKLGIPLVALYGNSVIDDIVLARQVHAYCAMARGFGSMKEVDFSLGKSRGCAYKGCITIEKKLRDNTLPSNIKDVLEFYDLI
jgi:hypothetical protein